ncbi:hypothetical protein Tco_0670373 [Tanacetum coccineum]
MYLNLWSYKVVRHRYSNPMIQPEPEGSTQGYPLVSVEVLRNQKEKKLESGIMLIEMELTLEQTQQHVSYEFSVDPHGFEGIFKDGDGDDDVLKSKNFKEVFVTLITERFSRSDEVLKLKNFKKDASLKLSSYQIKKGMSMSVQKSRVHKMAKFTRWRKEIMLG